MNDYVHGAKPVKSLNSLITAVLALAVAGSIPLMAPRAMAQTPPAATGPATPDDGDAFLNDLSLTHDLNKAKVPPPPGTWQKLINQPYFKDVPDVKAKVLLFYGQNEDCEILCNDLLKQKDLPEDKRIAITEMRLEAILKQGGATNIGLFEKQAAALPDDQKNSPHMIGLRARALRESGKSADAAALLKAFVGAHPATADVSTLANYNQYAALLEHNAQYADAIDAYGKVAELNTGELPENAALRTEIAKAVLRRGILSDTRGEGTSKRARQAGMAAFRSILQLDGNFWPAQLEIARISLEMRDPKASVDAAKEVINLDPYNIDARSTILQALIMDNQLAPTGPLIQEAKAINETPTVDALEGRILMLQGNLDAAKAPLLKAIDHDPTMLDARGWLAGIYLVQGNAAKAQEQLDAVKTADRTAHPVVLYRAGEVLMEGRQLTDAAKMFKAAIDQAAWWSLPYLSLGKVDMLLGDLAGAQVAYDKGFTLDAYDTATINQLRLLQIVNTRDTLETAHFIIHYQGPARINPAHPDAPLKEQVSDRVLAEMAGKWCEKIYPEVTSEFGYEPPVKTTVELYPAHDEFAVRVTGLTGIDTVGACTGQVIAMDAPRTGKGLSGNFDWARVLRHEFTHTVTRGMTKNRVPTWLTEAAAVHEEQAPRDWSNCVMLSIHFREGTLFKIANLSSAFVNTQKATDRALGYAEAEWLYEYLLSTFGHDKMLAFLHAFHDGKSDADAFQTVYGKSVEAINDDFLKWGAGQIKSWGLSATALPALAEAKAAAASAPGDAQAQKTLIEVLMAAKQYSDAEKLLREITGKNPKNMQAKEQLMEALIGSKKFDEARPMLEALATEAPDMPEVARIMGQQAMAKKDFDAAAMWFERLEKLRPLDETPFRSLAGVYLIKKDNTHAIEQLEKITAHEQSDDRIPRRLAQLYLDEKQYAPAQAAAFRALRINPYSGINHNLMAQILMAAGKPADAVTYYGYATELEPGTSEFWVGLADANGAAGNKEAAARAADKALEIDPNSDVKKWIQ